MRRSFTLCAALVFFVLTLALSSPPASTAVRADPSPERCNDCLAKTAKQYEHCVAQYGEVPACGEEANENTIKCYRHFCEQ